MPKHIKQDLIIRAGNVIYVLQHPDIFDVRSVQKRKELVHEHEYLYNKFRKICVDRIQRVNTETGKRLPTNCAHATLGQPPRKRCIHINCIPLNTCYQESPSVFNILPLT